MNDPEKYIDILGEVKGRHRDRILAIPGVIGIGVGSVYKDSERTGEIGFVG